MKKTIIMLTALAMMTACGGSKGTNTKMESEKVVTTAFDADSCYAFCAKQCDFGPRTMNSEAHELCGQWIVEMFRSYGMEVTEQRATLMGFDDTPLQGNNIIARYQPQLSNRILLCAHWDSRPWADNDPDPANHTKPVMAANGGASGVAVMLEVARVLCADTCRLFASMPRTGARRMSASHGPWVHSIGQRPSNSSLLLPSLAMASCSIWWVALAPASIRSASRCTMPHKW